MTRELEYILAIAQEQNISRAAARLNITQSSLSQFLSAFEANLGAKLFIRTSAGAKLTYSGELFVEYAQRAMADYRQICNRLSDVNHLREGQIRFAVGPERCCRFIPPILKQFHEKYPDIHVEIEQRNSADCIALLSEGTADLALLSVSQQAPRIPTEFVRNEEVLVIAAKDHPVLAHSRRAEDGHPYINLEDIAKYEFILTSPNTVVRVIVEDLFREAGLTLKSHYDSASLAFGLSMARQGLGLLFAQESLVEETPDIVQLSIGRKGVYRELMLGFPNHKYRPEAVKAFAREIHKALDE